MSLISAGSISLDSTFKCLCGGRAKTTASPLGVCTDYVLCTVVTTCLGTSCIIHVRVFSTVGDKLLQYYTRSLTKLLYSSVADHDILVWIRIRLTNRSVPEIIDPVFAKTSQNARFLLSENERFGLVFVITGSINSGTGL
jgi:hypothetical protein